VWGEDRVLEYSVATFKTTDLEQLRARLAQIFRDRRALGETNVPATIDGRPGTVYGDVVEVLDQAIFAGFTKINFVGAHPDGVQ
jgi:biopolymer transport protein ExbD